MNAMENYEKGNETAVDLVVQMKSGNLFHLLSPRKPPMLYCSSQESFGIGRTEYSICFRNGLFFTHSRCVCVIIFFLSSEKSKRMAVAIV